MKLNRKEFLQELSALYPVMGKGDANTSSNNYTFMSASTNEFYIGATNNSVAVLKKVGFQLDNDCRVSGNTLFQLIKKIKTPDLFITLSNEQMFIKTDRVSSSVPLAPEGSKNLLDMIVDIPEELFKPLPDNFTESLYKCLECALKSDTASLLSYIYIDADRMCSANNSTITVCNLSSQMEKMFIPSADLNNIKQFKLTHYVLKDELLYFKTDNDAFIIMQPANNNERYPVVLTPDDYSVEELSTVYKGFTLQALFSTDKLQKLSLSASDRSALIESLKMCSVFTNNDDDLVECLFDKYQVDVLCSGFRGDYKERVLFENEVHKFSVKTKIKALIDLLSDDGDLYIGFDRVVLKTDCVNKLVQVHG